MYMAGMFNLDKWASDAQYLILDDIEWKWLPAKKQLLGCQYEFELSDKYRRKRTVRFGLPVIYTMNQDNYNQLVVDPIWEWVYANTLIVHIENTMF